MTKAKTSETFTSKFFLKITLLCWVLSQSSAQAQTIGSNFQALQGTTHHIISSIGQPYASHIQALGFNKNLHQGQILPKLNPNALEQLTIMVFPNPAREIIHIQFSTDQAIHAIEVRDINGRIILSESFENPPHEVIKNINHLHPGIYTITAISTYGQQSVCKISKVKSIHQP